ncbi:hypothetical protein [Parapedobacter sp. SGR-10]|nr:hypothetical protein [Parapedobacter sp. SGR-10]
MNTLASEVEQSIYAFLQSAHPLWLPMHGFSGILYAHEHEALSP